MNLHREDVLAPANEPEQNRRLDPAEYIFYQRAYLEQRLGRRSVKGLTDAEVVKNFGEITGAPVTSIIKELGGHPVLELIEQSQPESSDLITN